MRRTPHIIRNLSFCVWFVLFAFNYAQTCSDNGCDQLEIADLHQQFSSWLDSSSDCNGDAGHNILDFACMINQVPGLGLPVFDVVPDQTLEAGQTLSFTVTATDPNDDPLTYSAENLPANATFDPETRLFTFNSEPSQAGNYLIRFRADDGFLVALLDVPVEITPSLDCANIEPTSLETSPAHGEREVAVTRETILRFSRPLAANGVYDASTIYAQQGSVVLAAEYRLSQDRKTVTLFYQDPLPASSRIRLTVLGDLIADELGCLIDADQDSIPGGTLVVDFDTLTLSVVDTR